jgi:hypothetical protein
VFHQTEDVRTQRLDLVVVLFYTSIYINGFQRWKSTIFIICGFCSCLSIKPASSNLSMCPGQKSTRDTSTYGSCGEINALFISASTIFLRGIKLLCAVVCEPVLSSSFRFLSGLDCSLSWLGGGKCLVMNAANGFMILVVDWRKYSFCCNNKSRCLK